MSFFVYNLDGLRSQEMPHEYYTREEAEKAIVNHGKRYGMEPTEAFGQWFVHEQK